MMMYVVLKGGARGANTDVLIESIFVVFFWVCLLIALESVYWPRQGHVSTSHHRLCDTKEVSFLLCCLLAVRCICLDSPPIDKLLAAIVSRDSKHIPQPIEILTTKCVAVSTTTPVRSTYIVAIKLNSLATKSYTAQPQRKNENKRMYD